MEPLTPTSPATSTLSGTPKPMDVTFPSLRVRTMTGQHFDLEYSEDAGIDQLKLKIAERLQIPTDLFQITSGDRNLTSGTLRENNIALGATITVIQSMQAGRSRTQNAAALSQAQGVKLSLDEILGLLQTVGNEVKIEVQLGNNAGTKLELSGKDGLALLQQHIQRELAPKDTIQPNAIERDRLVAERLKELQIAEAARKAKETENKKLSSKIETLQRKMQRSRVKRQQKINRALGKAEPLRHDPPVTGFAGLRRGFLLS